MSVWRTEGPREAERLEAFSDGVMAVIITIMALGLNVPKDTTWHAVADELPSLLVYVLSFTMIGIYWNNHHHLLQGHRTHQWRGDVGQPAPALLVVAHPGGHQMGRPGTPGPPPGLRLRDRRPGLGRGLRHPGPERSSARTVPSRRWRRRSARTSRATSPSGCTPLPSAWRGSARGSPMPSSSQSRSCGSCPIAASLDRQPIRDAKECTHPGRPDRPESGRFGTM